MLRASGIEHYYAGRQVLDLEEIALEAGTVTALVGANGSGKSTLLRILGFLERPTAGALELNGKVIATGADRLAARRVVTFVEQQPLLFGGTVRSNMLYGFKARGGDASQARTRVAQALALAGVEDLADRDARSLSDGETQKIAVARALALDPKVLLLDEPASAADRTSTTRLYQVIEEAGRDGLAVCFASHQLEDAYNWSDRLLSLSNGKTSPVTPENLFRVEIPTGEGPKQVRVGEHTIQVVTDTAGRATIALPPDDFIVSTSPFASSARNHFPGRVTRVSETGRGRVTITVDAGIELVARITPTALAELGISLGSTVVLSIKAMAVRVF